MNERDSDILRLRRPLRSRIERGCVETLEDALDCHGKSDIFDTIQAFTGVLVSQGLAISMDGQGTWRDNVFGERL